MQSELESILCKALKGQGLQDSENILLLNLREKAHLQRLFQVARELRNRNFGQKVFLYGFVYLSTHCRNNCSFCFYRRSNSKSVRYRKNIQEIRKAAQNLAHSGVHLIDLTMGEDPRYRDEQGFTALAGLIQEIKAETGLPVMISPGVVPDAALSQFQQAGADWYACYQETHSQSLYARLRLGQSFKHRLYKKQIAQELGMLIEEGILCGIGETNTDIAESIKAMARLKTQQNRVMRFVPQEGTPLQDRIFCDELRERIIMAVLRLNFPDKLIPASLDVDGLSGLEKKLDAGANVITSLVPPGQGLAGVAQSSLDIEEERRSTKLVEPVLNRCALEAATAGDYQNWLAKECNDLSDRSAADKMLCA